VILTVNLQLETSKYMRKMSITAYQDRDDNEDDVRFQKERRHTATTSQQRQ